MSYRETEECLAIQQEDIEDAYLQTQGQIEDRIRKIQKIEEEYKEMDKVHLQEIVEQVSSAIEIVFKSCFRWTCICVIHFPHHIQTLMCN